MKRWTVRGGQPRPDPPPDYWISYSDVMAGLIFTFILLLVLIMTEFRHQESQAAAQEQQLEQVLQENQEIRREVQQLLGVKEEIIRRLMLEFGDRIQIDEQTGAITFSDSVLFGYDSRTLSAEGRERLADFIPRYMRVLLSPDFRPHISEIIVEGHTDSTGGYLYNLELSQARARAVVEYIFSPEFPDFPERTDLQRYLTVNGRSFSQLVLVDGVEDPQQSRRVEFKFRLKDEEAVRRVQEMLEGKVP